MRYNASFHEGLPVITFDTSLKDKQFYISSDMSQVNHHEYYRGGSRISGGSYVKRLEVRFADFISFFLNIPCK